MAATAPPPATASTARPRARAAGVLCAVSTASWSSRERRPSRGRPCPAPVARTTFAPPPLLVLAGPPPPPPRPPPPQPRRRRGGPPPPSGPPFPWATRAPHKNPPPP